jgi:shikimate kinase
MLQSINLKHIIMPSQQNILEAWIEWATQLAVEVAKGLDDKKFSFLEGLGLTDNVFKLPKLIRRSKEFVGMEITDEMRKKLVTKFSKEFELNNKLAEQLVEVSVEAILFNASVGIKIANIIKNQTNTNEQ